MISHFLDKGSKWYFPKGSKVETLEDVLAGPETEVLSRRREERPPPAAPESTPWPFGQWERLGMGVPSPQGEKRGH